MYALLHLTFIWQPVKLFISSADELFGPITTLRKNGRIVKKIPWSAFNLNDEDWGRIDLLIDILSVSEFTNFANDILTLYCRILITSFTSFLLKNTPTYIVRSSSLNRFKQPGRKKPNLKNMPCITMHWTTGLRNCGNTIISLIWNRHFSLHLVSFFMMKIIYN